MFLAELKKKPFEEYLWYAQEITVRENILFLFEADSLFTMEELSAIANMKLPLRELYEEWRSRETDEMEILRNIVSYTTKERIRENSMDRSKVCQKTNRDAR